MIVASAGCWLPPTENTPDGMTTTARSCARPFLPGGVLIGQGELTG
ncbi:MAG: hypothetical protein PHI97_16085 [Desulfobulbus sp.]|nr:hypothetical protein [Desulfobulbus sp.]